MILIDVINTDNEKETEVVWNGLVERVPGAGEIIILEQNVSGNSGLYMFLVVNVINWLLLPGTTVKTNNSNYTVYVKTGDIDNVYQEPEPNPD